MFIKTALFTLLAICCMAPASYSQSDSIRRDSVPPKSFVETMKEAGRKEAPKSLQKYEEGRKSMEQRTLVNNIRQTIQRAKVYLKRGIDTVAVVRGLKETRDAVNIVRDGVFINKGSNQTQRNLAVSLTVLEELHHNMLRQQQTLEKYRNDLVHFKDRMDSLTADPALYAFPSDSVQLARYAQQLRLAAKEINPVEDQLNRAAASVDDLLLQIEPAVFELRSMMEDIEIYRRDLSRKTWEREFTYLWEPALFSRPFPEIVQFSYAKESLALRFYIQQHVPQLVIMLLLIVAAWIFLRSLRKLLQKDELLAPSFDGQLVIRHPALSAIFIVCSIFQFIFPSPPFIFNTVLWFITVICLTFIFRRFITRYWMGFWLVINTLFILACFDNMILQASRTERVIMLLLAAAGAGYSWFILLRGRKPELREKGILYFISFVAVLEVISVALNIAGRYNMAKTFMIGGYTGVVTAILLLWVARLLNEGLRLANQVYQRQDRRLFYLNFSRVGEKVPFYFYVLLVLGWLILVGRNFYGFKQLADPIGDFLSETRMLGQYEFSINSLLVFVLILICAMFLSRVISYFGAEPGRPHTAESSKAQAGSWILLLRIFVICLGLFLAFAATGIPIDRITIILGALGVGIGLGLQGLVNNLVSGLIIAFEKPVNVGDVIEIDGKPATMKSIGFRSSVVTSIDGPCIVIPNGELLNRNLVNWTMGKNVKRLSVVVGVAYGTDLEAATKLLENIVHNDERILKMPAPVILAKEFSHSSIDIELMFWARSISEWRVLRSDVVHRVYLAFKSAGIVIPFPQRDLHIKTMPDKPGDASPLQNL